MSLFDLQDVCIDIGSLATLDLPMVVDLIGIYGLKGPYCTLTMTDWFLQALSVIPRGSWGDVARRFTMIRWAALPVQPDEGVSDLVVERIGVKLPQSTEKSRVLETPVGARHKWQQALPVQPDEGVSDLVVERIGVKLPQSTEKSRVLETPVGARHKWQQAGGQIRIPIKVRVAL
ncbi:hypothetical protein F511_04282 [Dorcoceras hygrometricum]|uniref:Acyl-CoA dehydrogenase-related protein n=1 Tax=Dorcoceras hygrometricum TaxID=472368 RepID=A0A2Z7C214_9LAMI|nr:hypothetical protein F511_04282 [Dorcoceras hygrometricum]